jgi:hypothetical protein
LGVVVSQTTRLGEKMDEFVQNVRVLAYFKWEKAGKPEGNDLQFWLDAENELDKQTATENPTPNGEPKKVVAAKRSPVKK